MNPIHSNFTLIEYQEALNWLFAQAPNYQIDGKKAYKPGLDNIKKLCAHFGNPQNELQMIHVAGTNGKGSTTHMLASILVASGYKVGQYNSPHLIDFTERIKVQGQKASEDFVYRFIQKLKELPNDIRPSFFEFTTVMAFVYFKEMQVDYAIIEVGLGGRLDSTNLIDPILCAITNVALDHMDILGDTVEKIATEKAGIIKPGIPIVSGEDNESIKVIFKEMAKEKEAPFIDATAFDPSLETDLKGSYQKKNIKVVYALVEELRKLGLEISDSNLREGLLNVQTSTHFLGRWQEYSTEPLVILDTGHNHAGLKEVFAQLDEIKRFKHIVLGFVKDKKIEEVLEILPENASYHFVRPAITRGRDPKEYEDLLIKSGISYRIFDSVEAGYLAAIKEVTTSEMIFIGGSNFVVGEFLQKNLQ